MEYYILKISQASCLTLGYLLLFYTKLTAQIPTGTPRTDEPVRLNTTTDIIIYLILPLVVIVLAIFWWFFYKKPKNEREKRQE